MMDQEYMDTHPWACRPAGAPHRFDPPPPQILTTLLLPLLIGLAGGLFVMPVAAQTASCSASDTAVTAVITDGNDTAGRTTLAGDCAALLDIKDTLRGTGSLNWATNLSMASWDGVTVTGSRVTHLALGSMMLTGTIPAGFPDGLVSLRLHANQLTGPVPDLSGLTSLTEILFMKNELDGAIVASHFPTSLTSFQLHENQFTGTIPDFSGHSLTDISLADNEMSGTLNAAYFPASLTVIALQNNQLTGVIPSLNHLTSLGTLYLQNNRFSGEIPDLSATRLWYILVQDNQLSGSIDASHLPSGLRYLLAQRNHLTGSIPDLSGLSSLQILYLHQNELSGAIPASLGSASNLSRIYLDGNRLTGSIPTQLGSLSGMQHLHLAGNSGLTGAIPSQLGSLSSLQQLSLCGTGLNANSTLPSALETRRTDGNLTVYSCVSIEDASATEGTALSFTVEHDTYPVPGVATATGSLDVDYATADDTAESGDYSASTGTVMVPANTDTNDTISSATLSVTTTQDNTTEPDEFLTVRMTALSSTSVIPVKSTAFGRIENDDGATTAGVSFSPDPMRVLEYGSGQYRVWLNTQPTADVTLDNITKTGTNTGAATLVGPASHTFTAGTGGTWMAPATITVAGVDDSSANANRTLTLRHTATSMDTNYSGNHDLQLDVDDAPEVEAFWDWDGSTRRLHRPNTITSTDGATPDPNMYPLHNLSYVLRLSNRPEPGGTVTVTATVPADKANLVGLSLTSPPHREDTPAFANWARNLPATLTVEFKDREPNDGNGCNNSFAFYEDDYFDKNGRLRSRNGLKSESYDGTPDTPWKCWRNVVVVRKPASRNNAHTCADITHTASGGGVRQVAADTIRAHIWNFNNPPSSHRETCAKLSGTPQRAPSQAPPPVVPVQAVANVQVTAIDAVSATVTWDAVAHATGYQVEWEGHGAQASSAGILPGLTGTTATIPHDAPEAMTLTIRVMPAYVDGNGDMQVLDDLAGTATLVVGLAAYRDLIADVRGYAAENYGQAHQARWQRVLAAFGDANGSTPMTAPEAQTMADTYSRNRWDPVVEALTALKVCVSDTLYQSVTGYSTENYGQAHQARWQRVLAAFGDANGSTPMTATEAQTMADTYSRNRWAPVAKTLECLES